MQQRRPSSASSEPLCGVWASELTHSLRQVNRGRQAAVYRALGGMERLPLVPSSQGMPN